MTTNTLRWDISRHPHWSTVRVTHTPTGEFVSKSGCDELELNQYCLTKLWERVNGTGGK